MFEKTRMHSFQSDVFSAVAVIDAKTPNLTYTGGNGGGDGNANALRWSVLARIRWDNSRDREKVDCKQS